MTKTKQARWYCCGVIVLFGAQLSWAQQEASQADLERLKLAITHLQSELAAYRDQHSRLQQDLRTSEKNIGRLSRRIDKQQGEAKTLKAELSGLRQQRREVEAARTQQAKLVAAQLRAAYQLGREKSLKVLLNQEDPAQIARAMTYVQFYNRARLKQIAELRATIDTLTGLETDIAQRSLALSTTLQELKQQQRSLVEEDRRRQLTLASLSGTIKTKDTLLKQRQEDRDRLETLLFTVEDVTASFASAEDAKPFASRKGQMTWPSPGKLINRFGKRRSDRGMHWQGVQIMAETGKPVHAIHHGRVVFSDWFRGQGLLIIIDHGDGFMSLYSHNHSLLRETGDWVKIGEPIASVGSSGGQSESALYFEIRHKGVASNPSLWCRS